MDKFVVQLVNNLHNSLAGHNQISAAVALVRAHWLPLEHVN